MREEDLGVLLPLVRAYCAFYEETEGIPQASDDALLELSRALLADPEREGVQLLARDTASGAAIGFATVYWSWSTLSASRIAVMNDLFVAPSARGGGAAEALIEACREAAAGHGAASLQWSTALGNHRAQKLYDRVGGQRSRWLDYDLPVGDR
ncbi:N-acetyltransferase family protein [Paraconexibacter sp.]|uniref:GNAT family N-acetyltransferase n=1 Tax=Paraconexibacter sp. TaxID=2949640 RepID=UPI0035616B2D